MGNDAVGIHHRKTTGYISSLYITVLINQTMRLNKRGQQRLLVYSNMWLQLIILISQLPLVSFSLYMWHDFPLILLVVWSTLLPS